MLLQANGRKRRRIGWRVRACFLVSTPYGDVTCVHADCSSEHGSSDDEMESARKELLSENEDGEGDDDDVPAKNLNTALVAVANHRAQQEYVTISRIGFLLAPIPDKEEKYFGWYLHNVAVLL